LGERIAARSATVPVSMRVFFMMFSPEMSSSLMARRKRRASWLVFLDR
jgi:hypothetical protein